MGFSLVVVVTPCEKSFAGTGGKRIGIDKLLKAEFPVEDELSAPLDTSRVSSRIVAGSVQES